MQTFITTKLTITCMYMYTVSLKPKQSHRHLINSDRLYAVNIINYDVYEDNFSKQFLFELIEVLILRRDRVYKMNPVYIHINKNSQTLSFTYTEDDHPQNLEKNIWHSLTLTLVWYSIHISGGERVDNTCRYIYQYIVHVYKVYIFIPS